MRTRVPRAVYVLLFVYVAISLGYQVMASVSLITGYFDLRHQVHEPGFEIDWYRPVITSATGAAKQAGLATGDTVESLNGIPYKGRAVMQSTRFYARPDETMKVGIRRPDGTRSTIAVPLRGYSDHLQIGATVFFMILQIAIPLVCLIAGYWVALARPMDPNAWFILVLLSYPEAYISVSTFNWWPGAWLVLRLAWHLALGVMAPAAMLWLGLLFPERSRIDTSAPWLKWLVLVLFTAAVGMEFLSDYDAWYNLSFLPGFATVDAILNPAINWLTLICVSLYWVAIFAKLRTASTSDMRRRLRVLCAGSVVGLGSVLIMWGLLPRFGFSPANIQWLGYTSAVLMLIFPFSLAYVVLVQRALDVNILVRMGTRYLLARTTAFLLEFAVILLILFRVIIPILQRNNQGALTIMIPFVVLVFMLRIHFMKRPLAVRVRESIDRQFFRDAYNTEQVLSQLAIEARSIADPGALIQTMSSRISEVLHVPQMAVMLRSGDVFRLQTAGGIAFDDPIFLAETSPPVQHLVRTSAPALLYRDQPEVWFNEASGNEKRALNELHAEVLLPLAGRNRLMGVMVLGPKRSEEPYSPSDLQLLASIGAQAGLGLEVNELAHSLADEAARHQRVQREVEIAREVQQRLFPEIPPVPGLDIAGHCRPALGVGGDYYDVVPLEDGRLAIAIGDVSGKGIAAALLMASLRASLRGIVDAGSHDLARIVRKLNRLIHEASTANRYATLFFAIYNPAARKLNYVNAGHNPPVVLHGGEAIRLEACGPVVGLLKDVEYEEACLQLTPGDLFIGYTDGISEAMTTDDEEWGEERMQAAVEAVQDRPMKEILNAIFQGADSFAAGAPQYDDMTLLLFKIISTN